MNTEQASIPNWPVRVILGSSIPILLTILEIISAVVSEIYTRDGIHDTTAMNFAVLGGLYFALPCGLLNIIVGTFAQSKGLVKKGIAITGIIIGVLGILIGLLTWVMFSMVSSFVF